MRDSEFSGALSEQDYLAIVAINRRLVECRLRSEFQTLLKDHMLPLLQSFSCCYLFSDPDFNQLRIVDAINIPEKILSLAPLIFSSDPLVDRMLSCQRSVMAYDVDMDRNEIVATKNRYFGANPQHEPYRQGFLDVVSTTLVALSLPHATIGLIFHRLPPEDGPYTIREVRILELLWPILMQTIQSIQLSEELNRYQSLADSLAAVTTPIALINPDWQIVFRNASYQGLFCRRPDDRLPEDLIRILRHEMHRHVSARFDAAPVEIPFYQFERRSFRIVLTKINVKHCDETLWLLRMERIVDGYSKMIRLLQEKGLSAREIEICLWLKEGLETHRIADRLCVSYNTIRNHLQSIFRKTGVKTQVQLSAFLNKQEE